MDSVNDIRTAFLEYFARNGHEALGLLTKQLPDLLITDLWMPVMDGVSLVREVRHNDETADLPALRARGLHAG